MFCTNCGTQLPEDASFCMSCGAKILKSAVPPIEEPLPKTPEDSAPQVKSEPPTPLPEEPAASMDAGPAAPVPPQADYPPQPAYQPNPYPYQPQPTPYAPPMTPPQAEFPMKWFKFMIYFQLFLNAFLNLCNAVLYCTGAQYGNDADMVYAAFGGLRILDVLMGVICLVLAVYSILVRFQLAKFKKSAPMLLYILLACNAGSNLFYSISSSIVIGQNLLTAYTVGNIIGIAVLLVLNVVYFNKRKSLFIH